jgi:hypothetical protein
MLSVIVFLCWGQWCHDIQDNDTQHNDENEIISMYHNMLCVIVMSVIMLSVFMLMSVVP